MVRPGMINLDFADVETVMSAMGKAMMGTGEAEGENRATVATEMALNNPLIDEYTLQGAKGLLVNITGGKDITLFEVDQITNKIRAEVDPEAESIFGAIKDENMNGKIRVSIVATALDGNQAQARTVLNMRSRIHNRNHGYSENLFNSAKPQNHAINLIDGATALKLDENFEVSEQIKPNNDLSNQRIDSQEKVKKNYLDLQEAKGVSIENTSYIEENNLDSNKDKKVFNEVEADAPKLFLEEKVDTNDNVNLVDDINSIKMFESEDEIEEEFEIPAFLRKQKF